MGIKMCTLLTVFILSVLWTGCVAEEASLYSENLLDVSTECTRRCTLDDENLDTCWEQSLKYYTEKLAQGVSGYAATLLYLQRFRQRNGGEEEEVFEQKALTEFMKEYNSSFHDEDADGFRVQPKVMEQILHLLINASGSIYEENYTDELELLPNFACSTPCDYDYKMWRILFFVMLGVFVLSLLSFAAFLYSQKMYMREMNGEKLIK